MSKAKKPFPELKELCCSTAVYAISEGTLTNPIRIRPDDLLEPVLSKLQEKNHDYRDLDMLLTLRHMGDSVEEINLNTLVWEQIDSWKFKFQNKFTHFIMRNQEFILNKNDAILNDTIANILEHRVREITVLDLSGLTAMKSGSKICRMINQMESLRKLVLENVRMPTVRLLEGNHLMQLTYLDISNSGLKNFDGIREFRNLETLIIQDVRCGVQAMEEISTLTELRVLDISRTVFTKGFEGGAGWLYQRSVQALDGKRPVAWEKLESLDIGGLDIIPPEGLRDVHVIQTIRKAHKQLKEIGLISTPLDNSSISDLGLDDAVCVYNSHDDHNIEAFLHYSKTSKLSYLELLENYVYLYESLEDCAKVLRGIVNIVEHNSSLTSWEFALRTMNDNRSTLSQLPHEHFSDFGKKLLSIIMAKSKMKCLEWFAISLDMTSVLTYYCRKFVASIGAPAFVHALAMQISFQSHCESSSSLENRRKSYNNLTDLLRCFLTFFNNKTTHVAEASLGRPLSRRESKEAISTIGDFWKENHSFTHVSSMGNTACQLLLNVNMNRCVETQTGIMCRFKVIRKILESSNESLHKEFQEKGGLHHIAWYFQNRDNKTNIWRIINMVFTSGHLDLPKLLETNLLPSLMIYDSSVRKSVRFRRIKPRTTELCSHVVKSSAYDNWVTFKNRSTHLSRDDRGSLLPMSFIEILRTSRSASSIVEAMWILARRVKQHKMETIRLLESTGAVLLVQNIYNDGSHPHVTDFPDHFQLVAKDLLKQLGMV